MKLLKGMINTVERDNLKIGVRVIDTLMQATIATMSVDSSLVGRIKMVGYMLKNCIDSIEIDGKNYDPLTLATNADIGDENTRNTMLLIATLVIDSAFTSVEDEKK